MNKQTSTASEQLESAFELFNQFSEKLAGSYSGLEAHVARLSAELANARSERLIQLAEKELLANRLEGLLDALPAGIVVLDENDNIRQTNSVAQSMLADGMESKLLIGRNWNRVAKMAIESQGDELRLHDGRWVNVSLSPLYSDQAGEYKGKIILISDISETRSLQVKLNHQQRLSSLGEMIASLAHQIRTPLSSTLLYITALNHPINDEKERLDFAEKAKERLCHLERMVSDMLIFARGDVSDSEVIHAMDILGQLEKLNIKHVEEKIIQFDINTNLHNVTVRGNHDVLLSAFQNVIDNALDACINNTVVCISITCGLNFDKQFEIEISDNGCGMQVSDKNKILEPFYTTKASGTGLGMAVVNTMVNRYGGEINIESQLNKGSCISIKLPQTKAVTMLPGNFSQTVNELADSDDHSMLAVAASKEYTQIITVNDQEVA